MTKNIRFLLIGLVVGLIALATVSTVSAAEPANQACLGESVSSLAGPGFGQVVKADVLGVDFPGDKTGAGQEIQLLLAGSVPDGFFPNTCND